MRAIGSGSWFKRLTNDPFENRKIVLIQMHGGNDGLNTLIPMDQYATYQSMRNNIAIPDTGDRAYIPLDTTVPLEQQVGLHPDLTIFKDFYDSGKMAVVQNVGFENMNGSHFRGRDIWFMGGNYDEYKNSGWMGRYLDHEYPNYPDAYPNDDMPDPLGLEIGTQVSLGYFRNQGIPVALATNDPENFADLITGLGGPNPNLIPNNHYGQELQHVISLYANANNYAQQLQDRWNAGNNNVPYPGGNFMEYPGPTNNHESNNFAWQLQTVARLIQGGSKTRIYLVRIGGFDTHDNQVLAGNPTHGSHAALLYHLSTALKAFYDDLAVSGKDQEVVAMTFSEFGRRAFSNGSHGTDHGKAFPAFVFGPGVEPGIHGNAPDLDNLESNNLPYEIDYRQMITGVLCGWMGADSSAIAAAEFSDYEQTKLPLIDPIYANGGTTSVGDPFNFTEMELNVYPNPATTFIRYSVDSSKPSDATVKVYDTMGRLHLETQIQLVTGENDLELNIGSLTPGTYYISIVRGAENFVKSRAFLVH